MDLKARSQRKTADRKRPDQVNDRHLRRHRFEHECMLFAAQDENFAFIAGSTDNGFPYGITWEEQEEIDREDALSEIPAPREEDFPDWLAAEEERETMPMRPEDLPQWDPEK